MARIDRNALIGGQPVKVVRELMRDMGAFTVDDIDEWMQKMWYFEFVEQLLKQGVIDRHSRNFCRRHWALHKDEKKAYGVPVPKRPDMKPPAQTLFDQLLAEGYIAREEDGRYRRTIKGSALPMTRFVRRISRADAEALLKGVLERVAEINADPSAFLHYVTEVRVFGSYLTDAADLGDLDIAVDYRGFIPKSVRDEEDRWGAACAAFAKKHGKENLLDDQRKLYAYPARLLRSRITNGSHHISLHNTYELDHHPELGGKTIYTFTLPKAES